MGENFDASKDDINQALEILKNSNNTGELNMSVSAICQNDEGEKYAFVTFSDGVRDAEGRIPECAITFNKGFAEIEIKQLEKYMQEHLDELKKMAAGIDIFSAFTK
ncbi:MAG: hypothetical protein K5769_10125 [Pseudobutyrivibrio sp.]|nr:hypothetical protein [Pseudobutyrivibrio sp.]